MGICWFSKMGVPQNGWFIMEKPIQMDDLGVPQFQETRHIGISWEYNIGTFLELPWKLIDTARVVLNFYAHESHFAQCTTASKQIKMTPGSTL